ncbi:sigma-E processing peptidase SpoIIGA [Cohnella sp. JJ-181]|uniref:sigma-E processing peptidase SpoIIGA n=1 Tax=Cohnella rhizoplanae TaxID=2974897 RepID=UPI0022FF8A2A|nr:sigma-E processing peptidase SpoIIGA [Cohnella sp. JJ-181]CAI6020427.1 Sporulation sigma-E factor-processing peptidase [Cohnella sp. JJ-181]
MTVYVDLVFLSNLTIDASILLTTAKVRHLRPPRRRVALSASVGALYAAAMFVTSVPYLYSLGVKLMISALMVFLAFGYGGPLKFARTMGSFYLVNFATLGAVIGVSSLVKWSGSPWRGIAFTSDGGMILSFDVQAVMLAITMGVAIWLYRTEAGSRESRKRLEALVVDVVIRIGDREWSCRGLVDTGNRLYDPLTRIPVMIVEAALWRDELPEGWADRLKTESADRLIGELDDADGGLPALRDRYRLVPYRAAGGNSKLMLAVKPDSVSIADPAGQGDACVHRRVLVGLDGGSLSSEGAYRAIVHADLTVASVEVSATSTQTA